MMLFLFWIFWVFMLFFILNILGVYIVDLLWIFWVLIRCDFWLFECLRLCCYFILNIFKFFFLSCLFYMYFEYFDCLCCFIILNILNVYVVFLFWIFWVLWRFCYLVGFYRIGEGRCWYWLGFGFYWNLLKGIKVREGYLYIKCKIGMF